MRTSLKKKLLGTAAGLSLLVVVFSVVTLIRARRTFAAPYPDLHASRDPAIIERGRYLVEGAAHCAECHGAPGRAGESRHGKPLTGGFEFKLPIGTFRVPNITPDNETGIGRLSDREIARLLRHGVKPDGRLTLPFMPFANLSDDDLTAILSYLRAQNPVRHQVAKHDINALGEIVLAYVIQPKGPSEAIRKSVPPEPTAAYGRYLTHNVGNCIMCHTKVDMKTGALAGPIFGGGAIHESERDPSRKFVAPNLTPDPRWGWISAWTEEAFVARFHAGRVHADSPMPWEAFQAITDDDLRAIYRYFRTLPRVQDGPDPKQREVVAAATQ
jgi:mono/diheme cytochrome c family protein